MAELIQIPLQIDPKVDEALRAVDKFVTDAQNGLKKLTQGTKVNVDTTAAQKAIEQLADGYSDAKAQLNDTIATQKKALAALAGAGGKGSDEFNALVASIKSAEAELDKMEQAARDVDAALAPVKNVTPMQKLTQQYAQNRQALEATVQTQKEMLKALAATGDTGSKEFQEITASVKEAQAELKRLDQSADEVERSLGNVEKTSTVGDRLAKFGLAANGIQQVAGALGEVVNVGVVFDDTLKAVGAVTGASANVLADLGDRGRNLAIQFGGSASEQLQSFQGILSKFGADVAKQPAALSKMAESVNLLAKAGGIDAATAMNALTDTMLQMGLVTGDANVDAENSVRVIDALASSAQIGAAEIPDVAASMLQVGVAAKGAGLSVEQTTGALQVLAVGGKKGSEAGIALRNVLGLLQKASGPAEETMKKLGTSSKELGQILTTQGLEAAVRKLKTGMDGLGTAAERNAALMTIFGTENSAAAGILLDNTDKIKDFTAGIEQAVKDGAAGATGAVAQAAVNMGSAGAIMSRIKARVEDAFIGITSAVGSNVTAAIGAVNQLTPTLTGLTGIKQILPEGAFDAALDKAKALGGSIAGVLEKSPFAGALVGNITNALGSLSGTIASSLGGIAQVASKFASVAFGPWGIAIAAVVGALVLLYNNFEPFRNLVDGIAKTVTEKLGVIGAIISENVIKPIEAVFTKVSEVATVFSSGLSGAFEALSKGDFGGIGKAFQKGVDKAGEELDLSKAQASIEDAFKDANNINVKVKANADTGKLISDFEEAKKVADQVRLKFQAATEAGDTKNAAKFKDELIAAEKQTQSLAKSIGDKIPGALKETSEGYTVNTALAKNFVNVQSAAFAQDKTAAQKKFTDGLKVQGAEYQKLQSELTKVKETIANGKANTATIKQFEELNSKVKTSGDGIKKAFADASKAGLLTADSIANIAKSFGIPLSEAMKLQEELSKPAVKEVRLDAKKLAEDLDKALSTLGETKTLNIKAATQSTLNIGQLTNEYKQLEQQIRKEKDSTKKAELQGKLDTIKRELEANKAAQAETRKTGKEADIQEDKIKRTQEKEEFSASTKARRQAALDKAKSDAEQAAATARLRLNAIADEKERARAELKIKFDLEAQKIELERTSGTLSVADQLKIPERVQTLEKQRIEETNKLEIQFLKQDVERRAKAKQEEQRISIDTAKAVIETSTKLDYDAAKQRAEARETLLKAEAGSTVSESIRSLAAFSAQRDKIFAGAVDSSTGKLLDKGVTVLENRLNLAALEIQSAFEKFIGGAGIDEIPVTALGFPDDRTFELEARKYEVRFKDFQAKQKALEEQNAAELLKVRLQSTNDLAQLSAQEQDILKKALEASGKVRLQGVTTQAEREYAARAVQAKLQYDREKTAAGDNIVALAEAELKFRLEAAQNLAALQTNLAVNQVQGEIFTRIGELQKGFEQEIALYAGNEARKMEITRKHLAERAMLEQQAILETNVAAREAVNLFNSLAQGLSGASFAEDYKKTQDLEKQLKDARKSGDRERIKDLRAQLKEAEDLSLQIGARVAPVLQGFAQQQFDGFAKATKGVKDFSEVSADAYIQLGAAAGATFAQMIAQGEDVGRALAKSTFDALTAIVPILVAGIAGQSFTQLGPIAGPIAAAGLTAAFYGLIAVARAATGFKKGGYTGDGQADEEAGIVHKGEFVHTQRVTRQNREAFEYLHTGKTLEEYVQNVMLPKKPDLATKGLQFAKGRSDATIMQIITMDIHAQNSAVVNAINRQTASFESRLGGVEEAMRYAGREFKSKQVMELEVVPNNESYIKEINKRARRAAIQ